MRRSLWFSIVILATACSLGVATTGAATYHWTLAKRWHLTFSGTALSKDKMVTLTNVNGLAVSAKTPKRVQKMGILIGGECTRGSARGPILGTFTSHGLGTKTPLKLPFGSPNQCRLQLIADKPQGNWKAGHPPTAWLSLWRR